MRKDDRRQRADCSFRHICKQEISCTRLLPYDTAIKERSNYLCHEIIHILQLTQPTRSSNENSLIFHCIYRMFVFEQHSSSQHHSPPHSMGRLLRDTVTERRRRSLQFPPSPPASTIPASSEPHHQENHRSPLLPKAAPDVLRARGPPHPLPGLRWL